MKIKLLLVISALFASLSLMATTINPPSSKATPASCIVMYAPNTPSSVYKYDLRVMAGNYEVFNGSVYTNLTPIYELPIPEVYRNTHLTLYLTGYNGRKIVVDRVNYTTSTVVGSGTSSVKIQLGDLYWGAPYIHLSFP